MTGPDLLTASLAVVTDVEGGHCAGAFQVTTPPATTELQLRAIEEGVRLASHILAANPNIYQPVSIFTDSTEVMRCLIGPPIQHAVAHNIKRSCATLQLSSGTTVTIRWVPGHAGHLRNERTHELASVACRNFRPQLDGSLTEQFMPDPDDESRRRKQRRRHDLQVTVPINPDPLHPVLPRAAQVFINRARSGYALTDDVVARGNQTSNRLRWRGDSTMVDNQDLLSTVAASPSQRASHWRYACRQTLVPNIEHIV